MSHPRLLLLLVLALLLSACSARRAPGPPSAAVPGPWQHAFVDLPNRVGDAPLRVHYLAAGPVDAPRVVLVHGFPDLSYGWRGVLPELARDHRVLAPDLRGYGGTDRPEDGYGVRELADDVRAFLAASSEADGLPADAPVHLIGHDWGAAIGWWVAMQPPAGLLSYTALSVPHPLAWDAFLAQDAAQRKRATYQVTLARPGVAGLLSGLSRKQLARLYRDELRRQEALSEEDLDVYVRAFDTRADWDFPLRYYQRARADAAQNLAAAAAAGPVPIPVLVLWGEEDGFLYPRQAPLSCGHVAPGPCEVEVFAGAAHFLQWDSADAVVERWRGFVGGLPSVAPDAPEPLPAP